MVSGPLIEGQLAGRINFSARDHDGTIEEVGKGPDPDSLGNENVALLLRWTPTDTVELNVRTNKMDNDRVFGGANGGGLLVLKEEGKPFRNTTELVPGYRFIDVNQTANPLARNFYDSSKPILEFRNPVTGAIDRAQSLRAGIDDYGSANANLNGFQNAAASLTSFMNSSPQDVARYNNCIFDDSVNGEDVCATTSGGNWESFKQQGTQFSASWDLTDAVELKYLYGNNSLEYERVTDDDATASLVLDRQFYVNHHADYESHELQAFYDIGDSFSFTSGIFFYDATIDQRGDFYSSVGNARMVNEYQDRTALSAAAAGAIGAPQLAGISASTLAFAGRPMVDLYSAKRTCQQATRLVTCNDDAGIKGGNLYNTFPPYTAIPTNNLQTSKWYGDNGTNPRLNARHGPKTVGTDLLYATETERDAFATYTQGVWDISEQFTLTVGARYAWDEVNAEENVFRYSETGSPGFLALYGGLAAVNTVNGGLVNVGGNLVPTEKATNGGIPFALSVFRKFDRVDEKWTGRINLDWNINDNAMMYFSTTSGYRSGGYALVYFSQTAAYDPEELTAYEIGYKTQWLDNTLQVNGSFYYYDYETIHTFANEISSIGGITTSVLEAPGAEVIGIEAEVIWLATDNLSVGGTASYTPSEYTEDLFLGDPSRSDVPLTLYPNFQSLAQNINGNQLLQVPEAKAMVWSSYRFNVWGGSTLEVFGNYSWTDDVYFSPFESETEMAPSFDRVDLRATWTSEGQEWVVSGFVNNVLDEVGILHIERGGEASFFRQRAQTTAPRMYGLEVTYQLGGY
jgi:outer membrane receptor protein involved in Fe transport